MHGQTGGFNNMKTSTVDTGTSQLFTNTVLMVEVENVLERIFSGQCD